MKVRFDVLASWKRRAGRATLVVVDAMVDAILEARTRAEAIVTGGSESWRRDTGPSDRADERSDGEGNEFFSFSLGTKLACVERRREKVQSEISQNGKGQLLEEWVNKGAQASNIQTERAAIGQ